MLLLNATQTSEAPEGVHVLPYGSVAVLPFESAKGGKRQSFCFKVSSDGMTGGELMVRVCLSFYAGFLSFYAVFVLKMIDLQALCGEPV